MEGKHRLYVLRQKFIVIWIFLVKISHKVSPLATTPHRGKLPEIFYLKQFQRIPKGLVNQINWFNQSLGTRFGMSNALQSWWEFFLSNKGSWPMYVHICRLCSQQLRLFLLMLWKFATAVFGRAPSMDILRNGRQITNQMLTVNMQ